jgi:hypothetical protein
MRTDSLIEQWIYRDSDHLKLDPVNTSPEMCFATHACTPVFMAGKRVQYGETDLGLNFLKERLTVELPNLGGQILSYDGVSQKRRAIVAVIPSMLQQNQVLTYQPPYPAFIDLNNAR